MAHVFISYAHIDREYARKLADHLLENGFDVWIDDRIDFGSNWEYEIFKAIDDCSAFIEIMTSEAYKRLWVQRERQHAENRRKPAFPLLLEGEVFPFYAPFQYYDVRGGKLPEAAFLEQLSKFAEHTGTKGRDVAAIPQEIASHSREPSDTKQLARAVWLLAAAILFIGIGALIFIIMDKMNVDNSIKTPTTSLTQMVENTLVAIIPTSRPPTLAFTPTLPQSKPAQTNTPLVIIPTVTIAASESSDLMFQNKDTISSAPLEIGTIVDVVRADGNFTILLATLDKANLIDILSDDNSFTIFAPNDDAFQKFFDNNNITREAFLERGDLINILLYHIVEGTVTADNLKEYRSAVAPNLIRIPTMFNNENLDIDFKEDGTAIINKEANIIIANVLASNGVLHIIDMVLMPPQLS